MPDSMFVYGAHSALQRYAEGSQTSVPLDVYGGLRTSQHLPPLYELTKAGRVYTAQFGVVANAVASVTDIPTTGAHFALYNGNTAGLGGLSLVILSVGWASASGTVGIGAFAVAGVSGGAQAAALTTTAGNLIKSCSGSTRTSAATADSTATLTTAPAWEIIGNYNGVSGVGIGFGSVHDPKGGFLVPPTYVFGVAIVSPTGTTPAFLCSIKYAEVETYLV